MRQRAPLAGAITTFVLLAALSGVHSPAPATRQAWCDNGTSAAGVPVHLPASVHRSHPSRAGARRVSHTVGPAAADRAPRHVAVPILAHERTQAGRAAVPQCIPCGYDAMAPPARLS